MRLFILFFLTIWNYSISAQEIRLEIIEAKPIIRKGAEEDYRGFLLKVLIHNESSDTVSLLGTGYKQFIPNSYEGVPKFWSVIGLTDTIDQNLEIDVKLPVQPPPPPPSTGGILENFITGYHSIPPKDTMSMEIHSSIDKLYFPLEGKVYLKIEYHSSSWAFEEEKWEAHFQYLAKNRYQIERRRSSYESYIKFVKLKYEYMKKMKDKLYKKNIVSDWYKVEE